MCLGQSPSGWDNRSENDAVVVNEPCSCRIVGVDNQSALTTASAIVHNRIDIHRWPWALRPNGDIWSMFQSVVMQRGLHSMIVSKVKAHQKDEDMISPGHAQQTEAKGNANADYVAKQILGEPLRQYLRDDSSQT